MTQPAQEPIETTRDLASMSEEIELYSPETKIKQLENGIDIIINIVSGYYKISRPYLIQKGRKRDATMARQMCYHFIRTLLPSIPLKTIGRHFKRDHTSVINGLHNIEDYSKVMKGFKEEVANIKEKVMAHPYFMNMKK